MATATLARQLAQLRTAIEQQGACRTPILDRLRQDPARLFTAAGMMPDPWQTALLCSRSLQTLMLCSRQAGKSQTAAALALQAALLEAPALVLLLSPTQRQSGELFRDKVLRLYNALDRPVPPVQESALSIGLANGSRIISLPGDEKTIRGYSGIRLLIVDEAARVPDELYYSIRPMLAVSRGRLICLSTPFGRRGFFYEEWRGTGPWRRVQVSAAQCPRIPQTFLDEERRALGEHWYQQEYCCTFRDTIDQVFATEDILAATANDLRPLFAG